MVKQFPNLMSLAYIGNVEIRNRIVIAPLATAYGGRDG
jgi:2,4-dienoyl-CoA reductase-like NADH-dependent reductase (Old Yellow Enzyme family)